MGMPASKVDLGAQVKGGLEGLLHLALLAPVPPYPAPECVDVAPPCKCQGMGRKRTALPGACSVKEPLWRGFLQQCWGLGLPALTQ